MLTTDLVEAFRRQGELKLRKMTPEKRARIEELAALYLECAEGTLGAPKEAFEEAVEDIEVEPREKRLADGVKKLIEDGLRFEIASPIDPIELRAEVFGAATARRRALTEGARFDRAALVRELAEARGMKPEALEQALYADLKGAQVLTEIDCRPPKEIARNYELLSAQAVLLRATKVTAWVTTKDSAALRALFHKLKFHRLLYTIERETKTRLKLSIDGPFSLFESVTKYGVALAMALPSIAACGKYKIEAEVRWGKERAPLLFSHEAKRDKAADPTPPRLPDEVEGLIERFEKRYAQGKTRWRVERATEPFDVPGLGVCVPDLCFVHEDTGEEIFFEALGYWSRDAVWRRIELVEAGIEARFLFALSTRLRVSEAALDEDLPSALYVYKGTISAREVEERLDALAEKAAPASASPESAQVELLSDT